MADGLWTALYRDLDGEGGVEVIKFSEVSTGLSRYDYVDIQAKTAGQITAQPIDVAIILFGTNDAQGIELDGAVHAFGTPGWRAAYARRVDDLVSLLRGRGTAVYWVGLPKMKRESFDEKMRLINEVVGGRMRALNVPWIETTSVTVGADGGYEAYLPEVPGGRPRLMRAHDGIHMTMAGYLRIAAPLADRLRAETSMAPRIDRSMWPPRIMAKLSAEEKKLVSGRAVMVCLPALIRSASTSSSCGKGPMPNMPFSDCRVTFMPSGMWLATRVGMPIPRFT